MTPSKQSLSLSLSPDDGFAELLEKVGDALEGLGLDRTAGLDNPTVKVVDSASGAEIGDLSLAVLPPYDTDTQVRREEGRASKRASESAAVISHTCPCSFLFPCVSLCIAC